MANLIHWLLILVVALAPLPLGSNRPLGWSSLALAVAALLVMWVVTAWQDPARVTLRGRKIWPLTIGFLLVVAWAGFQLVPWSPQGWHHPSWASAATLGTVPWSAISAAPDDGVAAVMRMLLYAGVFWLAAQLGRNRKRAARALYSIAAAATLYALYGLWVHSSGDPKILWYDKWAYPDSVSATFVNRNSFATYAGIAMITALAIGLERARAVWDLAVPDAQGIEQGLARFGVAGWTAVIALPILATALMLSLSRAGVLAAGLGLFALLAVQRRSEQSRSTKAIVIAIGLAALLIVIWSGAGILERIDLGGSEAVGTRLWMYERGLLAVADRPWLGSGIGSFEWIYQAYRDAEHVRLGLIDKAHNSYLEMVIELGIPAAALLFLVLGSIVWRCLVGTRQRRRNAMFPALGFAAGILVGSHALVDFSIQIPAVACAFALILGTAYAQSWPTSTAGPRRSRDAGSSSGVI